MKTNRVLHLSGLLLWSTSIVAQISPENPFAHKANIQAKANTSIFSGDVDGDGALTKKDITILSNGICGKIPSYANPKAADFNNDGVVNIQDLVLLIDAILHPIADESNGHKWVDLGLSVKWATCNVGANVPEDYGDYYAWGETSTKSSYTWNSYLSAEGGKMTNGDDCGTSKDPLADYVYPTETSISATEYDVAHTNWGGQWRMPTLAEQNELRKNCYWQWTKNYNGTRKAGYIVYKVKDESDKGKYSFSYTAPTASYSLTDTHIFLPASGYRRGTTLYNDGNIGFYWSADPTTGSAADVFTLNFDNSLVLWLSYFRNDGFSVRPVIK